MSIAYCNGGELLCDGAFTDTSQLELSANCNLQEQASHQVRKPGRIVGIAGIPFVIAWPEARHDVLFLNHRSGGYMVGTSRYPQQALSTAALSTSITLHVLVILALYLTGFFSTPVEMPEFKRHILIDRFPPPPLAPSEIGVLPRPAIGAVRVGHPVPVPDVDVSAEQTIADQREPGDWGPGVSGPGTSGGDIVIDEPPPSAGADPPDFQAVEIRPVPVKQIQPRYPEVARMAGIEGTVYVKILVGTDGKARKAIVQKSDAEVFNEPAIEAAMQWIFTPAMMNNGPVAFWASVPFRFRLSK